MYGQDCETPDCLDSDKDGVCDGVDKCPGYNDLKDENRDGIPDGCEKCSESIGNIPVVPKEIPFPRYLTLKFYFEQKDRTLCDATAYKIESFKLWKGTTEILTKTPNVYINNHDVSGNYKPFCDVPSLSDINTISEGIQDKYSGMFSSDNLSNNNIKFSYANISTMHADGRNYVEVEVHYKIISDTDLSDYSGELILGRYKHENGTYTEFDNTFVNGYPSSYACCIDAYAAPNKNIVFTYPVDGDSSKLKVNFRSYYDGSKAKYEGKTEEVKLVFTDESNQITGEESLGTFNLYDSFDSFKNALLQSYPGSSTLRYDKDNSNDKEFNLYIKYNGAKGTMTSIKIGENENDYPLNNGFCIRKCIVANIPQPRAYFSHRISRNEWIPNTDTTNCTIRKYGLNSLTVGSILIPLNNNPRLYYSYPTQTQEEKCTIMGENSYINNNDIGNSSYDQNLKDTLNIALKNSISNYKENSVKVSTESTAGSTQNVQDGSSFKLEISFQMWDTELTNGFSVEHYEAITKQTETISSTDYSYGINQHRTYFKVYITRKVGSTEYEEVLKNNSNELYLYNYNDETRYKQLKKAFEEAYPGNYVFWDSAGWRYQFLCRDDIVKIRFDNTTYTPTYGCQLPSASRLANTLTVIDNTSDNTAEGNVEALSGSRVKKENVSRLHVDVTDNYVDKTIQGIYEVTILEEGVLLFRDSNGLPVPDEYTSEVLARLYKEYNENKNK
ncbi:MAG: hypothetical protein H6604_07205 [Flavobacteriales bacterium]|nr:hypothetical protein [Flavobacteriales bacterium]